MRRVSQPPGQVMNVTPGSGHEQASWVPEGSPACGRVTDTYSWRMAASGSILVARRAGRMQAASATTTITKIAPTTFAASAAVSPNNRSEMKLAVKSDGRNRGDNPGGQPGAEDEHGVSERLADDRPAAGAERHPNPQFGGLLRDGVHATPKIPIDARSSPSRLKNALVAATMRSVAMDRRYAGASS